MGSGWGPLAGALRVPEPAPRQGEDEGEDEGTRKGPPTAPHHTCLYIGRVSFLKHLPV